MVHAFASWVQHMICPAESFLCLKAESLETASLVTLAMRDIIVLLTWLKRQQRKRETINLAASKEIIPLK